LCRLDMDVFVDVQLLNLIRPDQYSFGFCLYMSCTHLS
jgi:hypothetical protein